MKVTKIETIRLKTFPSMLFLQVYTDEGLIGLGENCVGVESVETFIHESIAPRLLGKDPAEIARLHETLHQDFLGFSGSGIAVRAASSVDIALWDILGQIVNQPIYQLLGGKVRERIRTYNTCAGPGYAKGSSNINRNRTAQLGENIGDKFEDLVGFLNDPESLVSSLIEMGFSAMKIWPFDEASMRNAGQTIDKSELRVATKLFERARIAGGEDLDIMLEMHALWSTPAAITIANAVEEYSPFWVEDPVKHESTAALQRFRNSINSPLTVGETTGTRWDHHRLLSSGVVDHLMIDPGWVGGITEANNVLALASTYGVPVAPHDCTGPVVLTVGTHLGMANPQIELQEMVRAYYFGWYAEIVTILPEFKDGYLIAPTGPGLGTQLRPEVIHREDAMIRVSTL
jgi:galactonate dehydratase